MIEDGHFKELKLLLDFIYTKRVEYKKQGLAKYKVTDDTTTNTAKGETTDTKRLYKEQVLK